MATVIAAWAAHRFGWPWAFFIVGGTGFVWLLFWLPGYQSLDKSTSASPEEVQYIRSGQPPIPRRQKFRWTELLRYRQAWPFIIAKFLTDPVWWFYSGWLPDYLHKTRGLSLVGSAGWLAMPYIAADIGSICGGWLSGGLMNRGWNVGPARYMAMGLCALGMPGAIIAVYTGNFWLALGLISLATASHQGWSANLFTTASDLFPSTVTGSMIGIGGMAGAVGGMLMSLAVGNSLAEFGSYVPVFIWAGLMHPLAWVLFFLIAGPKMKKAEMVQGVDSRLSPKLLIGGFVIALLGMIRCSYVWNEWHLYPSPTVAAGAFVAGSAVALIGLGLLYASLPRTPHVQTA
jgi:ACS family hexuronate transporter-like MFS transporter